MATNVPHRFRFWQRKLCLLALALLAAFAFSRLRLTSRTRPLSAEIQTALCQLTTEPSASNRLAAAQTLVRLESAHRDRHPNAPYSITAYRAFLTSLEPTLSPVGLLWDYPLAGVSQTLRFQTDSKGRILGLALVSSAP